MPTMWRTAAIVTAMSVTAGVTSSAQEVGARPAGTAVVSPEIASDRRVTLRLRAPEAKAVTASGDFGPPETVSL